MTHLGPSAPRSNPISRGDATQPSSPASRARSASRSTCDSTLPATPRSSGSAFRSRLVRTVTPITSGRTTPKSVAAFVAASAAARIIAKPPDACTSSMNTPSRVASRTAPATVFGMSWYLRSRNTREPRLCACSTALGPAAVKSWVPIFTPSATTFDGHRDTIDGPGPSGFTSRFTSPRRSSSASASARVSTSSATKSREAESEVSVILLQAPDTLLALQQRFDGSDRGLDPVHRQVVGDVLRDGGAPEGGGVLAGAPVLRGVDDERDLTALHQVDG